MDFRHLGTIGSFPADRAQFFAHHIHPDGKPEGPLWTSVGHEYLEAILADTSRHRVIRKAAQVGASTIAIGEALHDSTRGLRVGYYFPNRTFMAFYVQDRIDPIINADNLLAQATTDGKAMDSPGNARLRRKSADNTRIKNIGQGTVWFQGLQSKNDAKAVAFDSIILDELTELDPSLVPWLDDRLLHSVHKLRLSLSQPGVPDFGIDAEFMAGDQKYFMLKCRKCRRWCNLIDDWPDCLQLAGSTIYSLRAARPRPVKENRIVCKQCGTPISIPLSSAYEWVAKERGREISSYALSQLYGPYCDANEVARRYAKAQKSRSDLESLTVSVVGLPYAGDRQPLNDDVLTKASGEWQCGPPGVLDSTVPPAYRTRALRLAGIDVGTYLHAVVAEVVPDQAPSSLTGAALVYDAQAFSGEKMWEDLANWLRRNGVTFFVIDAQPETSSSKALCRAEGLNGAMSRFSSTDLVCDFEEKQHPFPIKVVKWDRTEAIDDMADAVTNRELLLPSSRLDVMTEIRRHCKNLVKDLLPTGRYAYKKGVENHYGLALTYLRLARRACTLLNLGTVEPFGSPDDHFAGEARKSADWE